MISLKWQREEYRLGDDSGLSTLLMPGVSYSYLRSDNRIDPHNGYRLQFDAKVAKEGLGSDNNLLYGTALFKGLTTVWDKHRFLGRVQFGGSATNGYKSVPPSLRFFAGGDLSVRGYEYQTLSPENSDGDRIGGRYMVAGSVEYQYPGQFLQYPGFSQPEDRCRYRCALGFAGRADSSRPGPCPG